MALQTALKRFMERLMDAPRTAVLSAMKDVTSLGNLGMQSVAASYDKCISKANNQIEQQLQSLDALPTFQYRSIAGVLMDLLFEHLIQKLLEVRRFTVDDACSAVERIQSALKNAARVLGVASTGKNSWAEVSSFRLY